MQWSILYGSFYFLRFALQFIFLRIDYNNTLVRRGFERKKGREKEREKNTGRAEIPRRAKIPVRSSSSSTVLQYVDFIALYPPLKNSKEFLRRKELPQTTGFNIVVLLNI